MAVSFTEGLLDSAVAWLLDQVNSAVGGDVLSATSDGGLSVELNVPGGGPTIDATRLQFGSSGFSGTLGVDLSGGPLSLELFGGFSVSLSAFSITLTDNTITGTDIAGALTIPYFTNSDGSSETIDIEVAVGAGGALTVTLAAQQHDPNAMTPDGLVSLHYDLPLGSSIDLEVATLEVSEKNGLWTVTLTGSIALDTAGIDWPTVQLRGLSIDSAGHISLEGGWIDLPSQAAIDFFGFHVALQQLGFGSDTTGRWIGFSGDVNLVEGVPLGGSVRGLQINLDTGAVSFAGVSVSFEIPDVLTFSGEIDHAHLVNPGDAAAAGLPSGFPVPADVFAGGVDLTIEAAGGLEIDAQFIVARVQGTSCFFLAVDAELPIGIPLFADVALYGMSGMFATNLSPNIGSATWWDWYKYPTASDGTPDLNGAPDLQGDSGNPDFTATDVFKWLNPVDGALALGAGAVLGTQDDGFTASASIAFILILPGPVMMLIGKANILSPRISGPGEEANFEAMATYDGNAGTFDLVIEAQYSIPVVLDVHGTAELFVDPGAGVWYLAIGAPPHEKRVTARILDLFESDFYFVVSDSGLVAGFWVGYKNSWSFGPLSASIDAYLAAMAAIQKSPLQLGAGVELHGEVHLSAFGIGLGLTADALIEATTPHPWWVYGSLSFELDLPWPLPNVGGSVSLSWGGSGPPPPAPLALSSVDATLVDHGASDRYELLAHRAGASLNAANPADTVVYDSQSSGILDPQPPGYWAGKYTSTDLSQDPTVVLPDLDPSTLAYASLVPQDSHFTLHFAHPMADLAGFDNSVTPPPDLVEVSPPASLGADDMSNINLQPPAVQWSIRHSLVQVALYQYSQSGEITSWELVAATPQSAGGWTNSAPLPLVGSWLAPDPAKHTPVAGTALKLTSYAVLPGESAGAAWGGSGGSFGTAFSDQGLQFSTGAGAGPAAIASPGSQMPPGLRFSSQQGSSVTITFPSQVVLTGLSGVAVGGGEFPYLEPTVLSGGQALTPSSVSTDASGVYTLGFSAAVSEIELAVGPEPVFLMSLAWTTPDIDQPILPQAPGLYALKTVTRVEAGQPDSNGNVSFQAVADGNPVIEFAYLQTASGPGTATVQPAPVGADGFTTPDPDRQPPQPGLAAAANAPASAFPNGGRLGDLATYTQWSWPGDGDSAAYYGYDINVEFTETYVNSLYATFLTTVAPYDWTGDPSKPALHLRCVDRNQRHTLLVPTDIHVPSAPMQSANSSHAVQLPGPTTIREGVGGVVTTHLGSLVDALAAAPAAAAGAADGAGGPGVAAVAGVAGAARAAGPSPPAVAAAQHQLERRAALRPDHVTRPALASAIAAAALKVTPDALGSAIAVNPGLLGTIRTHLQEVAAASAARQLWFVPLQPRTRYTLDVVAGPIPIGGRDGFVAAESSSGGSGGLLAIYEATDSIDALAALQAFLAREDALTSLQRVQFATSRYATFSDQVANVLAQSSGSAPAPIRRYAVPAAADAQGWLAGAGAEVTRQTARTTYLNARQALAGVLARFDPLWDVRQAQPPADATAGNGEPAIAAQRAVTEKAWQSFAAASATAFDGLVAALGRPDLASNQKVPAPPDTELSLFTSDNDLLVQALLLESPEPLPWRRMWQWTSLQPEVLARPLSGLTILWSSDQTRALLVPLGRPAGRYALTLGFEGNIGAEVACITLGGTGASETPTLAPIRLGPQRPRIPVDRGPAGPVRDPIA
jgi:hypothetical protein